MASATGDQFICFVANPHHRRRAHPSVIASATSTATVTGTQTAWIASLSRPTSVAHILPRRGHTNIPLAASATPDAARHFTHVADERARHLAHLVRRNVGG